MGGVMKIRVGGYKVKLVHKTEAEMPEKDGHFYPAELVIGIREGQLLRMGQDTLLHECLHAVLYLYGITTVLDIDEATEEKLVFQLATALLSLLQDNPKLVKALTKEWPCPSEATSSDASCSPSTLASRRDGRRGTERSPSPRRSPRPATLDATPTRRATA